jgi:hypothetical protein
MMLVIGSFAALAYMYLKRQGIETGIDAQVAEYRAQQTVVTHDVAPDATYDEIRSTWIECSKTDTEQINSDLTEKEKRSLLKGVKDMHDEAVLYDKYGPQETEIQGIMLEMANY